MKVKIWPNVGPTGECLEDKEELKFHICSIFLWTVSFNVFLPCYNFPKADMTDPKEKFNSFSLLLACFKNK